MAVLTPVPLVMKDVELIIGVIATGDDFRKFVDGVTFTPSASTTSWTGLGANTHTDVSTATWTLDLSYVQDWESTKSLSKFLFENEGKSFPAKFRPKSGVGASFTAEIVITPGSIGGTVNSYSTTTVSLGVNGKPVLATT